VGKTEALGGFTRGLFPGFNPAISAPSIKMFLFFLQQGVLPSGGGGGRGPLVFVGFFFSLVSLRG